MKKVVLSVRERLGIGGLLNKKYQQKGLSLETLNHAQKIVEKLTMDEKERKGVELKSENGRLTWDLRKDKGKDVEFSEDQIKFLKEVIQGFSESKEFSLEDGYVVDLIEKISAG